MSSSNSIPASRQQPKHMSANLFKSCSLIALLWFGLAHAALSQHPASWPVAADGAESAGFASSTIAELDDAMRDIVSNNDVAGMVWFLAKDGKVATFEAAGYASIEDQRPMSRDTLFRIYSMTKPVTGVALMILHEQGLWDFDDPVSKFIPEFVDLKVMVSNGESGEYAMQALTRQPTMRELLNHSAGFGYGLSGDDPVNSAFRDMAVLSSADLDEMISKIAQIPLLFQPGEQWFYSVAVDIQGYIVEQLTGQRFGEFLAEHIYTPLAMHDTAFYVTEADRERFADVYRWDREQDQLMRNLPRADRPGYFDSNRIESGGGGLVSSTHDYARFLQMLVNGGGT